MTTQLPAGFIDLDGAAVHVATLRRFTTDVHRFQRLYPIVRKIQAHAPGSAAWVEQVAAIDRGDLAAVQTTLTEAGALHEALASELDAELLSRSDGPDAA